MLPKLTDILDLLEEIAPARLAEPWDNPGLQVGSCHQEISKILIALDPTLKNLKAASRRKANLLLTHHPLIFKPISRLDIGCYPGNVIVKAAEWDISIVAIHTNLDVSMGGINDILADLMGLQHIEVLQETAEMAGAGLGRIGDLPKPENLLVVTNDIKRIFGVERCKVVGQDDDIIRKIAVVGGSGGSLVSLAFDKGADLLLTGDIGHHHALEAESLGIALVDGGHFHTERTALGIFADNLTGMMRNRDWDIEIDVGNAEFDPMHDFIE